MASEWQINRLHGLLTIKMIREQISFANRLAPQSITSTNKQWWSRTQADHSRLKSGPPLWGLWAFIRTSLFLAINWRLASEYVSLSLTWQRSNSSQLTIERSRVHRRWASCLRLKACLHWSSNQGLWPCDTDDLGWNKTSNQQQQILIQNLKIFSRINVTPEQILHCTTNYIKINLMFEENFPTHTQVWNSLIHQNDCRQGGVIWVTYGCFYRNQYYVRNISHQEGKCSTTCMGRADNWWGRLMFSFTVLDK